MRALFSCPRQALELLPMYARIAATLNVGTLKEIAPALTDELRREVMQCNAMQCNAMQCNAMQCGIA